MNKGNHVEPWSKNQGALKERKHVQKWGHRTLHGCKTTKHFGIPSASGDRTKSGNLTLSSQDCLAEFSPCDHCLQAKALLVELANLPETKESLGCRFASCLHNKWKTIRPATVRNIGNTANSRTCRGRRWRCGMGRPTAVTVERPLYGAPASSTWPP